jgi:hypothetical protein
MLRVQEAGVEEHVPEAVEGPLLEGFPSPGEKQAKEADRGDQVEHTGSTGTSGPIWDAIFSG